MKVAGTLLQLPGIEPASRRHANVDAPVFRQRLRRFGLRVLREVRRRTHDSHPQLGADPDRHHVLGDGFPEPHAGVEPFGHNVRQAGLDDQLNMQIGVPALTVEQDALLATTPTDELLALPMLQPDQVTDPLHAYQLSKRANALRVKAEAVRWGKRGARVNTISPGIIMTPLANDELSGPRGAGYRRMIDLSPAGRAGTPDEVGTVGALLMGPDGAFITGSDFLMDGGVTASFFYGELAP